MVPLLVTNPLGCLKNPSRLDAGRLKPSNHALLQIALSAGIARLVWVRLPKPERLPGLISGGVGEGRVRLRVSRVSKR